MGVLSLQQQGEGKRLFNNFNAGLAMDLYYPGKKMFILWRPLLSLFIVFSLIKPSLAQRDDPSSVFLFQELEDSLHRLAMQIIEPKDDQSRLDKNALFMEVLEQALLIDSTLTNPFDSVKTVSFLSDPRGKFRVITWYVPLVSGNFRYFGFVQTQATKKQPTRLYRLDDHTASISMPTSNQLGRTEWYGAWYYELIHLRHHRKNYYTLLGWKGNNPVSRKRVIEPFELTEDGPIFGAQVFKINDGDPFRIIFEYSSRVSMSLKYEPEFPQERIRKVPMIVFDHLIPLHETFRGNFQNYVPEVNVLDGFRFQKGQWIFVPDVDARVIVDPELVPLNPPRSP